MDRQLIPKNLSKFYFTRMWRFGNIETAKFMFNSADAITNNELAGEY